MAAKNKKLILKLILLRRIIKKRSKRRMYIRSIFQNRVERGESLLVRELSNDAYYHFRYFRMDKGNYDEILDLVSNSIQRKKNHLRPISPTEKLAVTIRFLATGNSQVSLALNYRISPQSVSIILREVMTAICDKMGPIYLPNPTEETWKQSEEGFRRNWNFPNACGAMDGKHVKIRGPRFSGSKYYNYKNFYSIVLLAIVDPTHKFIDVDIGASGSQSDGGVYTRSQIGKSLQAQTIGIPPPKSIGFENIILPHVILADHAFSLKLYLMKTYPGKFLEKDNRIFNYRLSRARMTVENAFGVLAARFRVFNTSIAADMELSKLVVKTTVILHNFLLTKNDMNTITIDSMKGYSEGNWRQTTEDDTGFERLTIQGTNNYSASASEVREKFKKYFNTQGAVTWQNNCI